MCGIAGIYSPQLEQATAETVRLMNNAIAHRGPDDEGYYFDTQVALAHRRLAILDLSPAGHQPMTDNSNRYEIIFNGEIYNFREVRNQLTNYSFRTQSDTEVILAAYQTWGVHCLNYFNGMFAFALWDKTDKTLFIARDRLGIKPLYYAKVNENWFFASEVRSLLAGGMVKRELNREVLPEFFTYQTVHAPQTLIKNVSMLMPGHYILLKNGAAAITRWWSPRENYSEASYGKSYSEVCSDVRNLFTSAVERRLISDVPFGAFLSGGIDSSAVVGIMSRIQQQPVKTFTISFGEKEFSEAKFAKKVSEKFRTEHHEFLLTPDDFLKALPTALRSMDHPSGDGPNSYIVSELTRKNGVTMALSGLGGDELFAGYPVFNRSLQIQQYNLLFLIPPALRTIAASVYTQLKPGISSEKLAQLLRNKNADLETTYPVSRQVGLPKHVKALTGKISDPDPLHEVLVKELSNRGKNLPLLSKVSVAEMTSYMQNVLLRDTDQMSMSVALEVRVPFLDFELVEYVLGVNDQYKRPSIPKKMLVDSLGDLLPDEVVHRKKMGFVFPWETWLKNELKALCEEKIQHLIQRDILDGKYLSESWSRFLKGDKNVRWLDMWLCVVLEFWLETNHIEA